VESLRVLPGFPLFRAGAFSRLRTILDGKALPCRTGQWKIFCQL